MFWGKKQKVSITGNKGEWSELYAFLKILSDKRLHSADESLRLIPDSFLKVLSVIRREGNEDLIYDIDEASDEIVIRQGNKMLVTIPMYRVNSKLAGIFTKIKKGGSEGAFALPEAELVMEELHCAKIKSASSEKSDISLKIEDPHTGTRPIRGFSIKSKVGGLSSLLNASGATNFEFEIVSIDRQTPAKSKPLIELGQLLSRDESLRFVGIQSAIFRRNLSMIDSHMPKLMGEIVKAYYLGYGSSLKELTKYIEDQDPLEVGDHEHFYQYKTQELLIAIAFGMQPATPWNGSYETHGGYIIVKENGELACYHVYDRDRFKKFLHSNTKLETPSRSRHKFGHIYERDGRRFILLNLQIRFNN